MVYNGTEQLILSYIFSKRLYMGIVLACMSVHHMPVVPGARSGYWILWNWSYTGLLVTMGGGGGSGD